MAAVMGVERNMPGRPQISPQSNSVNMITTGCNWNDEPMILGSTRLPLMNCTADNRTVTINMLAKLK